MRRTILLVTIFVWMLTLTACHHGSTKQAAGTSEPVVLMAERGYPQAICHQGRYYFTCQSVGGTSIDLFATDDITKPLDATAARQLLAATDSLTHFWSPEIHRVDGKWYVYFEADDGNTDNHHMYVMECADADPMTGTFHLKGVIDTRAEWNYGIHPTLLQVPGGGLYLLWSGWPDRRHETETQCIYIVRMENPWTTASSRVMISKPEYEWERQWINPDGTRSAYPIYVNENPETCLSPDGKQVIVFYSASGIWTEYTSLGMLTAPADADLLRPEVWTKRSEPLLPPDTVSHTSTSDICLVPAADGHTLMLYELKRIENGAIARDIYVRPIAWDDQGMPQLSPAQ